MGSSICRVTEPLGDRLATAFTPPHAAQDNRFALNYYRPLPDGRLLWGGRVAAGSMAGPGLEACLLKDLLSIYPQLEGVRAETVWGGVVTYTHHSMPAINQPQPGLWHCLGFGGHGLVPTQVAGQLLATAIASGDERWRIFAELFPLRHLGPRAARVGAARLGYAWYRLRDWVRAGQSGTVG